MVIAETNRSVGVEVSTHILDLKLQLLLCPPVCALHAPVSKHSEIRGTVASSTLKARCSRKCAVPLFSSVSAREPASIHMPTVEVCA